MKHSCIKISLLSACLCAFNLFAQTKVDKVTALKSNEYGVKYFLPKTEVIVQAKVSKVTAKSGPYYRYAEKYLGISDPVTEDQVYYTLDAVTITTKGVPDKDQAYLIEFKAKTTAPFACLTEDGLLCTINADYQPEKLAGKEQKKAETATVAPHSVFTEEYLQAGSTGRMAEVSAKQIYRLRESRMDLLTGEAENVPRDGEGIKLVMQQLELQEKALEEQFKGSITSEEQVYEVSLIPEDDLDKNVLFRFSKYLGIVSSDDLSGIPVYMNLKNLDKKPEITDPKLLEKMAKDKANPKGVIYNVPGKASIEITAGTKKIYTGEIQVAQFGDTQTLLPNIFEDKKAPVKVYFYPETGALKQVIQ